MIPRIGIGFDVHAMAPDRPMILCGVTVPHELGLAGHSDADVGIHALCDAIYGALAEGDIGRHFPPSEAAWKDADSARFLRHAAERIRARGGSRQAGRPRPFGAPTGRPAPGLGRRRGQGIVRRRCLCLSSRPSGAAATTASARSR